MCLSKHILFKSDKTDKNMTWVGKSRIVNEVRCLLLAESTVQIIKDQKGCECNQNDNRCPMQQVEQCLLCPSGKHMPCRCSGTSILSL